MRNLLFLILCAGALAQTQNPNSSVPAKTQPPDSPSSSQPKPGNPKLAPPRSDRVDAASLGEATGESSSKDTQIDISAPPGDAKDHPQSADILTDEGSSDGGGTTEFHPWDPHKAAKDVEVGDYYFKRKNYLGAESRYREALLYKENDADATYKLALCLEKMQRFEEATEEYQSYLKILPEGPESINSKKAIERLKSQAGSAKSGH